MRRIVILLGPPGVGKGTVSRLLVNHFQFEWLSSGDLLRKERSGADLGEQIAQLIDAGRLVPDELIISLVEEKLSDYPGDCNLLLDGFPRTINQAVALDAMLKGLGAEISLVLELQADNEELERRILGRAEEEGRRDDNLATLKRRMQVFHDRTAPLIEFYLKQQKLQTVDARGMPAEVFGRASLCIQKRLPVGTLSSAKEAS